MRSPLGPLTAVLLLVALAGCSDDQATPADGKDDVAATVVEETTPPVADLPSDEDLRSLVDQIAEGGPSYRAAFDLTKPGSPARGYLTYLAHGYEASVDGGYTDESKTVAETEDGYEACSGKGDERSCYIYGDFEGEGGQVVDFAINGKKIGPRLVMGSDKVTAGNDGLKGTFVAAFETSDGKGLIVSYKLRVRDAAFLTTETAYRARNGRQSVANGGAGPNELAANSMAHFTSVFPGAKLGGVATVVLYGEDSGIEYTVSFDTAKAKANKP